MAKQYAGALVVPVGFDGETESEAALADVTFEKERLDVEKQVSGRASVRNMLNTSSVSSNKFTPRISLLRFERWNVNRCVTGAEGLKRLPLLVQADESDLEDCIFAGM